MICKVLIRALCLIGLLVGTYTSWGQSEHSEKEKAKLGASLSIGHTWIPAGEYLDGSKEYLLVPSWGLDLSLELTESWGINLANEILLQRFFVKTNHEETIEREYPFTTVLEGVYKTRFGLGILMGPGIELEKNKNYFVYRIGVEYNIPINEKWFVKPSLQYESKELVYDIFSISLGIGFLK